MEDEPKIDMTGYNEIIRINPKLQDPKNKLVFNLKQLVYLIMVDWVIEQLQIMINTRNGKSWQDTHNEYIKLA